MLLPGATLEPARKIPLSDNGTSCRARKDVPKGSLKNPLAVLKLPNGWFAPLNSCHNGHLRKHATARR